MPDINSFFQTPNGLSASIGYFSSGVTFATTVAGTTANFTGLVSSTVGFSGAGTNLTGNASGLTAGTSTKSIITDTNSSSTHYPVFTSAAGNTGLNIDSVTSPLTYVPSTGTVTATTFAGTNSTVSNTLSVATIQEYTGGSGVSVTSLTRFSAGISAAGGTFSGTQTFVSGATFQGNIVAPNIVTSFNGLTGAVGGVTTSAANTFTALQTFNSGISASGGVTFTGQVTVTNFKANTVGGDEGGQVDFGLAATNTSLTGGVAIDIYQNKIRFFETGGSSRGAYIDLTGAGTGVGSNLDGGARGYAGVTTGVPTYTYPDGVTTYNSGKQLFYQPVYSNNDQGAFTVYANRTYFSLFNVGKATTINTIRIVPSNTVTTGNCHLSIYDADPTTGLPKTRLWSSASIAVGSGYTKTTASPNYTVPAGYFYLAASFSSTPIMYGYQRTYSLPVFGAPDLTSGYRGYYFVADTNGFTAPSAIPASGVTFALVDYTTANYAGVRIEFAI